MRRRPLAAEGAGHEWLANVSPGAGRAGSGTAAGRVPRPSPSRVRQQRRVRYLGGADPGGQRREVRLPPPAQTAARQARRAARRAVMALTATDQLVLLSPPPRWAAPPR